MIVTKICINYILRHKTVESVLIAGIMLYISNIHNADTFRANNALERYQ